MAAYAESRCRRSIPGAPLRAEIGLELGTEDVEDLVVFLQTAIRGYMKGMSPAKAHAFLQSLPNVVDARVTQSPYGLPWLPLFGSRITLKIQEVSNNSPSP